MIILCDKLLILFYKIILMKELLFYSIFAIVLYFVLTQVFENFNIEQENFDPSLVPVSSIVTLAKVAQKLVNGNGTLTNPGNLQSGGSASAPGNLTVTGNFLLGTKAMLYAGGDKFANDNWVRLMKADGATAYSGMDNGGFAASNLYSQQDTTVNRNLNVVSSISNGGLTIKPGSASPDTTLFQFGDGTGWRARFGKAGSPTLDVYDSPGGGVQVTGNLSATGVLQLNGSNGQINDNTGVSRLLFHGPDKNTYYDAGAGNIHYFRGHRGADGTNINVRGNLEVMNTATTHGNSIIGSNLTVRNNQPSRIDLKDEFGGHPAISTTATDRPLWILPGNKEVSIGHPDPSFKSNLTVTGNITLPSDRRLVFSDGNNTIGFNPGDGVKIRSWNGGTLDTVHGNNTVMSWDNGGVTVRSGKLFCIGGTCINEDHLKALKGEKEFMIQSRQGSCVDVGNGRYSGCNPGIGEIVQKIRYF
jgi:hypothetical protein